MMPNARGGLCRPNRTASVSERVGEAKEEINRDGQDVQD
jgi:hypothetical protein